MSDLHAHFDPLRPPSRAARAVVLLTAPLLWLVVLSILAAALDATDLIWYGLAIAAGSCLLGIVVLLPMRARRVREEREPGPPR